MPGPASELPEGTDHIVNGALETRRTGSGSGEPQAGFVGGTGASDDTGGTAMIESTGDEGIRGQLRRGVMTVKDQAGGRIREFADDGKTRASNALDEFSRIVEEAAESIDERFGEQYSPYARHAAEAVSNLATTLRDRDVDQLYEDARDMVRKSPVLTIGIAAALGFVAVRLIKAGLPEAEAEKTATGKSGKRRAKADA